MARIAPIFRHYETVVLVRPDQTPVNQEQFRDRIKDLIEGAGGRIARWETWGKRRLAYEIRKQNKAHYLYVNYVAPQLVVAELERNFRIIESVLKYQTVKLSDEVIVDEFDFEAEAQRRTSLYLSPEEAAAIERNYQREQEWAAGASSRAPSDDEPAPAAAPVPAPAAAPAERVEDDREERPSAEED